MPAMTEEGSAAARWRRTYPKEFRRDAAALVIDQQRSIAEVARELGVASRRSATGP